MGQEPATMVAVPPVPPAGVAAAAVVAGDLAFAAKTRVPAETLVWHLPVTIVPCHPAALPARPPAAATLA